MAFNQAHLITSTFGSKDFTEGLDQIVISMIVDWSDNIDRVELSIPKHYSKINIEDPVFDKKTLYQFEFRPQFGFHLKPIDEFKNNLIGPMCNGVIAEVPSRLTDQLSKMVGYPIGKYIPVHDRYETQEVYDNMCR